MNIANFRNESLFAFYLLSTKPLIDLEHHKLQRIVLMKIAHFISNLAFPERTPTTMTTKDCKIKQKCRNNVHVHLKKSQPPPLCHKCLHPLQIPGNNFGHQHPHLDTTLCSSACMRAPDKIRVVEALQKRGPDTGQVLNLVWWCEAIF